MPVNARYWKCGRYDDVVESALFLISGLHHWESLVVDGGSQLK